MWKAQRRKDDKVSDVANATYRPSHLAESLLFLDGKPFSIKNQPYIYDMYDSDPIESLSMYARQCAKSTTVANKIVIRSMRNSNKTLYVAPTAKQVSTFSNDRLKPAILFSPFVRKYFMDKNCSMAVMDKDFANGSVVHLRSCYLSPDTVRGTSANDIFIDEVQDIMYENIYVIREAGSAQERPIIHYSGTPKTENNTLGRLWKKSLQIEWALPCHGCGKWNVIGEKNLGKTGVICSKCGKPLIYLEGRWMATNPRGTFPGYRLPQPCTPFHQSPDKWRALMAKYGEGNIIAFYNEVLALPYSQATNPITEADIAACCNENELEFMTPEQVAKSNYSSYPKYAGVDYGRGTKSFTVLSIIVRVGNKSKLLYAKKYVGLESNSLFYTEDILSKCAAYRVAAIGADYGDGSMQNDTLRMRWGAQRFIVFFASDELGQIMRYNQTSGIWVFNRTRNLQNRFLQIKNKLIDFPKFSMFKPFSDMITCVYIEYSKDERKFFYDHDGDNEPDDFLHSWNYAEMVAHMAGGTIIPTRLP